MPRVDLTLDIDIERTPRVIQLEGLFDVPQAKRRAIDFHFDAPFDERDWRIGLITGPSGAGKSSVARHLFADALVENYEWPAHKSVVDGFGDIPIKESTGALSAVGFSSPPSWTKPYSVLSTGEKFRANLARALIDARDLVVMDEFTSVIDRTVAKVGSFAVSKAVRRTPKKRFVAVSCHDDIVEWLQPDWILEPHIGRFRWRSVQRRPPIDLTIVRCDYSAWRWFAPHHYLTADLNRSARCFVGLIEERPAAFAGLIHFPHAQVKNIESVSRLVVAPDFQGLGLGAYDFIEAIGKIVMANGGVMTTHPAHPALIKTWAKSALWKLGLAPDMGYKRSQHGPNSMKRMINPAHTHFRRVAHFRYVGPGFIDQADIDAARRLWSNEDRRWTEAVKTKVVAGRKAARS
jgi:ABC-type molybdenum transport system ATPase subunit/photorepair protein PhrA